MIGPEESREEAMDRIWADEDGKWEVVLVSAVVEALSGEEESEDAGKLYISCARPVISVAIAERSSR